jgi:hypothetical protein
MLLLFFSFFINTNSEITTYEVTLSSPHYFDGRYKIFSRNHPDEHIFGYDKNHACLMRKMERHINVYIQNSRTLEKTAEISFEISGLQSPITIVNCFKYNGNSFIIYKQDQNDETTIIRGNNEMRKIKIFNYDAIRFDHNNDELYIRRGLVIYRIASQYFEKIWDSKNISQHGVLKMDSVSILDSKTTDFLIFNNYIYFIKEFYIYKRNIYTKVVEPVSNSSSRIFNFISFEINNKIIYADSSKILLIVLYVIDMIVIFIFIYFFKNKKFKQKSRYEDKPIEMETFIRK